MNHPFERLPRASLKRWFWTTLVATLLLMALLNLAGSKLITVSSPYGIISYELAGNVEQAQLILNGWDHPAKISAAFNLGLDYLFMLAYSTAIGLGCIWSANTLRASKWPFASLGAPLAWGQWLAALLDVIENIALVVILFGSVVSPWPELARWCAIIKFSLVFLGLTYVFLGLSVSIVKRIVTDQ